MSPESVTRWVHLLARRLLTGMVHMLPPGAAEVFRDPAGPLRSPAGAIRLMATHLLRRGGIPAAVDAFALPDNPSLRFVNADSLVLQQLYWFGEQGWEPELLPWWRYFCRRSSSIVELGANVGYYTVQGARAAPHARYLAVEPHPASVRACRVNLALNRIDSVEVIAAAAVADPSATATELMVPWEQLEAPTVAFMPTSSELPSAMARRHGVVLTVPAVDVRSLLDGVDLLKLDVEGQEYELLAAAWEQLQARHPTIVIEVLPDTPRLRVLLVELCEKLGYRCYAPVRDRLIPLAARSIPDLRVQHTFGTNDLILSADPDMPTVL